MSAIFFIAFRHLRMRLRTTALAAAGVTAAVLVMSVMQSMMLGLQTKFTNTLLDAFPHVLIKGRAQGRDRSVPMFTEREKGRRGEGGNGRVRLPPNPMAPPHLIAPPERSNAKRSRSPILPFPHSPTQVVFKRTPPPRREREIKNYRRVMAVLQKVNGVTVTTPTAEGRVIVRYGTQARPATLVGIVPDGYENLVDFRSKIIGDPDGLKRNTQTVFVGKLLAENLGIVVGNRINVVGKNGSVVSLRVTGLYSSGVTVTDETRCFCPLRTAQLIHDLPSSVTRIALKVNDVSRATSIARRAEQATGLEAQSWQEANANFWGIFRVQNIVTSLNVFCTLLVAGSGIANSLMTMVLEKTRDIGILKAIGLTSRQVGAVFLVEALCIAVVGATLGALLASRIIEVMSHTPMRGRGFMTMETFAMLKVWWVYGTSVGFALLISILASFIPVLKAASAEPVEIIRYAK